MRNQIGFDGGRGMSVKAEWISTCERVRYKEGELWRVTKSRGKLTLDDISDALRDAGVEGYIVMLLKIGDTYDGWNNDNSKGDAVDVYIIEEGSPCPVCSQMVPLIMYCPECGKKIDTLEVKEE